MSARISGAEHPDEPTGADRVAGVASALPSSMEPHAGATSGLAGRSRPRPLVMFNYHTLQRYSGKPSGISNYMFSLMRALLARGGMDLALCTSWRPEQVPADLVSRLAFVEHRQVWRPRLLDVVAQAAWLPTLARRRGVDVIVNADPLGTPAGAARRITVVHDLYFKSFPGAVRLHERLFYSWIVRAVLNGSDRVVCVSETTKADLARFYPGVARKAVRIYEDAAIAGPAEGAPTEPAAEPYLLFVGNVVRAKNIGVFYEALDLLARDGITPRAVIVGRDPDGIAAECERRLVAAARPERRENLSDDELARVFAGAACLVNTSLYEGFCLPVVEAQRLGIPVVCSRDAAVGEIAGEGALLVDPRSPAEVAAALRRVLAEPDLRNDLAERGRANARRFSWADTARDIEDLIFGLMGSGGRAAGRE